MSFYHSNVLTDEIMKILLTLCNLLVCVMAPGPTTDYCFVNCHHSHYETHLVCKRFHSCPKPKTCIEYEANKQWRQDMLDILNDARNGVANGSKKFNFGNPGAKNMYALSYDMELEYIITCYQNQCDNTPELRGCMQTTRFTPYVIGLAITRHEFNMDWWRKILVFGDKEKMKLDPRTDEGMTKRAKYHEENYQFMRTYAWRAKYVGCVATHRPKSEYATTLLCLIGPGIDNEGDIVYKVAKHPNEIASECEEGRNRKYPALCGNIDEVSAETMWSHLNITPSSSRHIFCENNLCKSIMIYMSICAIFEI